MQKIQKSQRNLFSVITFLFMVSIVLLCFNDSKAIPSFARKYKTSCQTCHSIYPKLNPFGEAFRINGYQFPQDEEDLIKEERVQLGSEMYKRVWPDAVWPNSIPASVPISLRSRMGFIVETEDDRTFGEFGLPTLQLIAAGTMGEDISAFVGAHLFEDGEVGSLDRMFLKLDNLFTGFLPKFFLYFKMGQFIPELVTFASNHRGLTNTPYAFNTYSPTQGDSFDPAHVHGSGASFGIENFQLGIEASGVIVSRLRYVAGLVNGNGTMEDNNSDKDFYGSLRYKLGGLAFDGTGSQSAGGNNLETSFTLGAFGYNGTGNDEATKYDFHRYGVDFNLYVYELNLYGGYITGKDGVEQKEYNMFFAEANYLFYPWLMGILRYEQANPENENNIKNLIPNITTLLVANIKFMIETRLNPENFDFDNLYIGMDFAF